MGLRGYKKVIKSYNFFSIIVYYECRYNIISKKAVEFSLKKFIEATNQI